MHHLCNGLRGNGNDHQIHRVIDVPNRSVGPEVLHGLVAGIYREYLALEATVDNIAEHLSTHRRIALGCAYHGDRLRLEDLVQVMLSHLWALPCRGPIICPAFVSL